MNVLCYEYKYKLNVCFAVGLNALADLSNSEYRKLILGSAVYNVPSNIERATRGSNESSPFADTVDWRTKGVVSSMKKNINLS